MPASAIQWLVIIAVVVAFWALLTLPARRQQRAMAALHAALGIGDEVIIASGIYGRVAALDDETVALEIAPGTVIKVARQAVVRRLDEDQHRIDAMNDHHEAGPEGLDHTDVTAADPADEQ